MMSLSANNYDHAESDSDGVEAPAVRWAPLGAVADSSSSSTIEDVKEGFSDQGGEELDTLREENEKLANSLLSLTSHFAQVQFRLRQITDGPDDMKASRLKELESFAERGIPDIKSLIAQHSDSHDHCSELVEEEYKKKLTTRQKEMIVELRSQLADLESYVYESGMADELPTSKMLEKQEVIIEQIKRKLQISHLDNISELSSDELKECVDEAISQIINPAKLKEKQLEQLRTQVHDLERFVDFLQAEVTNAKSDAPHATNKPYSQPSSRHHLSPESAYHMAYHGGGAPAGRVRTQGTGSSDKSDIESKETRTSRLKRIVNILHLFILSELGCASRQSEQRSDMKSKATEPHYGDMLAEMQMSVDALVDTAEKVKKDRENSSFTDCDYLSDEETYISESKELTQCVRKRFAISLRKLIEHGTGERSTSKALMPFGGCTSRNSVLVKTEPVHAWKVVLMYYKLKDGLSFNNSTSRKLAESFGIQAPAETDSTVKTSLLSAIGHIIETHTPYHRSDDAHFKAFISMALNNKKLVPWLRQILRTSAIVDAMYLPWSYLVKTNFEDAFCAMNKLKLYEFNLPVDLAVKQFSNIKDAF